MKPLQSIKAQGTLEYLLTFSVVVVIVYLALRPNGFITSKIDTSMNMAMNRAANMGNGVCLANENCN